MELLVDIQLIPKGIGIINNISLPSANSIGCNNESAVSVLSEPFIGAKPYLLGISLLDYGDTYSSENYTYDGFISEVLSDKKGLVFEKNEIVVSGTNLDHLIIIFDQKASQWATKLSINDKEYTNVGPQFVWQSTEVHQSVNIKILEWNTSGYPFRITGIFTGLTLQLNNRSIKDCVRGSQCSADNTLPKFGVLAGYGSLTIYDVDGELEELAEMGIIKKGSIVKMYIDSASQQIGEYIIEKWNYETLKNEINVNLKERIDLLEHKTIFDLNQFNTIIPIKDFLVNLVPIYESYGFRLVATLPNRLKDVTYSYVRLNNCNCRTMLEDICKLHGLYAMQNEIGEIVFIDI